ncbi:MAG: cytochrome c biogenesis heme-transporting ATPase CcmA [Rhodocyclaceae bacterium]|nr:cytochrome c biogenesis heme-transporting ATPase CcmA [Rhodocyclaceae bacterium]
MLSASGLACVRGDRRLFSDVAFSLSPGEWLHVEGENGAGKTSLLRIVAGLLHAAEGEIRWGGTPVDDVRDEYHEALLYLGHAPAIKEDMTPLENLRTSAAVAGRRLDESAAFAALGRIGLKGREELPARFLSQGQKRRVALARLLVSGAKLWVLDEPFVALDVAAVAMLGGLIGEHLEQDGMVLLTSHQEMKLSGRARSLRLGK